MTSASASIGRMLLFLLLLAPLTAGAEGGPSWAVPYGEEFWHGRAPQATAGETEPAFNVGSVIERVSCAIQTSDGETPTAQSRAYTAQFTEQGLTFSPRGEPAPQFHFRTESIRRGDRVLYRDDGRTLEWLIQGNTAQALLNPELGLLAHVETRREGVEVSWILRSPPPGPGDLVIELDISGQSSISTTSEGTHLGDAAGVARTGIGPATAVDAAGRREELAMDQAGSGVRYTLPAGFLDSAAYPVAIDPFIYAEFGVNSTVFWGNRVVADQEFPEVAWGETNWLVVWEDDRNGSDSDVLGTRVSSNGTALDTAGIVICGATGSQDATATSWNGTNWLVVWRNELSGVKGARVAWGGNVLDAGAIVIATNGSVFPAVCWGGTNWLVAWGAGGDADVYGARVDATGGVLDAGGFALGAAARSQLSPALSWNGTNWLAVWDDTRNWPPDVGDIYGARVDGGGSVLDGGGIAICTATDGQYNPAVSWGGTNWLVTWQDSRSGTNDIYGARVSGAGAVGDAAGIAINTNADQQTLAGVCWGGTNWVVVWQDGTLASDSWDIRGARVTPGGVVLDVAGKAICTNSDSQGSPAVSWNGTQWLVVWHDDRDYSTDYDIYGVRVNGGGTVLDGAGRRLSTAANFQEETAVAWGGTNWLVVWSDMRSGTNDICGTRVSSAGTVLDASGIGICTLADSEERPAVSWGTTNWLVVWESYNAPSPGVYGTRVSPAGVVLNPGGVVIDTDADVFSQPKVSWGVTNWLVVWQSHVHFPNWDVFGRRVRPNGTVLDALAIPIGTNSHDETYPDVSGNGTNWLVVWRDARNGDFDHAVYGARVGSGGSLLDALGIGVCTASMYLADPVAAWGKTNWLVAWDKDNIFAARVGSGGEVLDPVHLFISTNNAYQSHPDVAWDGRRFWVAWQETTPGSGDSDIYTRRVSDGGVLLGPEIPVNTHGTRQQYPVLAAGTNGYVLFVYESYVPTLGAFRASASLAGLALTAACGPHGTVSPSGTVALAWGASTSVVVSASPYCYIQTLLTNGAFDPAISGQRTYTSFWQNVTDDAEVAAGFGEDLAALGTPHWWLALWGLTNGGATFDQAEADDTDKDTFSAHDEYTADTVPTNGASFFCLTGVGQTNSMAVWFACTNSRAYSLEYKAEPVTSHWSPVTGPSAGEADGIMSLVDPADDPQRFYRVKVALPP